MKKIIPLLLFAPIFFACEEIPPVINPGGGNSGGPTPVEDQQRQVLIEEFTGVKCVNCPAGSEAIENLLSIHGQRLVAVSIHAGFFAPPYPESKYDFRTPDGNSLLSFIGEPLGFPTAVVNRRHFDGEEGRQLGQSKWAGYIAQELALPPQVRIDLQPDYNPLTRQLKADVTLYVQSDITAPDVRLSLALTESDIEDYQLTPDGKKADYKHKHVLRDMISTFDGNPISEALTAGAVIEKTFSYTLDENWKPAKCDLIAFVSLGGDRQDVLQAHRVKVVE